jgi:GTP-binding protein
MVSRTDIEAGRKLFATEWQFLAAADATASLPAARSIEVAFAGRSNVGKSSLINALTGRRALARISRAPGRTQELIFFVGSSPITLVDMPGYGYAAAGKAKVKAWTALIHEYLRGRGNLARVYVLIDARHGLKDADENVLGLLDRAAVNYQLVLTKVDQIKPAEQMPLIAATETAIARRPAAYPQCLLTSVRTGAGIAELRAVIARLVAERRAHSRVPHGRRQS